MSRLNLFATLSLCTLSLLAPLGCAADPSDDTTDLGETDDALTAVAQSLVGKYYDHAVPTGGIGRLTLQANGKYSAQVEANGRAMCIVSPCLLPEEGTWNATKSGGKLRLRLKAQGQSSRYFEATKSNAQLVLKRAGQSQTLTAMNANQCLDDADCTATEECGPKLCLMYCLAGDPFCCGPSTCQPKAPAPKSCGGIAGIQCGASEECVIDPTVCDPTTTSDCMGTCQPQSSCWGAWLDQNGLCRTPADGVYPPSCCAGM